MKHAGQEALDRVEDLLIVIRQHQGLKEKKRGIFYRKSSAFLHFHEDQDQIFADLRLDSDWQRFPVNTQAERETLLARMAIALTE